MALSSSNTPSYERFLSLDLIRGIAILLMIIFHLFFDLNNFKFINIDIYNSSFWHYFRFLIVSIFLLCVGISMFIANIEGLNFKRIKKRFIILILASLVISISTFVTFPNSWIYFGILHFVAFVSIFGIIFVFAPNFSLFLGIFIVITWNLGWIDMHWFFNFLQKLLSLPIHTEDSVPLTPWFGVVLIGIFIGSKNLFNFKVVDNKIINNIAYLGKHSLIIYLIHQPILFGSIFLLHKYIN